MNRTTTKVVTGFLLAGVMSALVGTGLPGCARQSALDSPEAIRAHVRDMNVLVIFLDAAAASHFSFMGYGRQTTPNIDRVASDAVVFTDTYAQASATPLSMYSVMTSRNPILDDAALPAEGELATVIPAAMPTWASRSTEHYPTRAAFVANRWLMRELGFDRGFSEFHEVFREAENGGVVRADKVSDQFLGWLDDKPAGPWFSWVHYLEPHEPYTPPEPFASKFAPENRGLCDGTTRTMAQYRIKRPSLEFEQNLVALYDGNLAWADAQVGRVIDALQQSGEWDNTILVITSDHGEAFWEHGVRGHGFHVYEEFVRVPLLIRVPGVRPARISTPTQLVDLAPTLLDLAGIFVPEGALAGRSRLPELTGEGGGYGLAFSRNHRRQRLELGVRKGDLKYIYHSGRRPEEIFDLQEDPQERHNLLPIRPPVPRQIDRTMREFQKLAQDWVAGKSGTASEFEVDGAAADSLDADTMEALRAIGYFGN